MNPPCSSRGPITVSPSNTWAQTPSSSSTGTSHSSCRCSNTSTTYCLGGTLGRAWLTPCSTCSGFWSFNPTIVRQATFQNSRLCSSVLFRASTELLGALKKVPIMGVQIHSGCPCWTRQSLVWIGFQWTTAYLWSTLSCPPKMAAVIVGLAPNLTIK